MPGIRRATPVALVAATAALLLAACTTPAPHPAPSNSVPATVDACDGLQLEAGSVIPGSSLGPCVEARMRAANTFHATGTVENDKARHSTALVSFDPFEISLDTDDEDDPHALIITDDATWGLFGDDWVAAGSADPRATAMAPLALLTLTTYSADSVAELLGSADEWTVSGASDTGWTLQPGTPPSMLGVALDDASLVVGDDFLPMRTVATGTFDAMPTTFTQDYTDWGAGLDFPPLPAS